MRSSLGRLARRAARAVRTAAAVVTTLAVLLLAVSHVEADHAPTSKPQSVATSAPCAPAPSGPPGAAAECSAPCVAALAPSNGTRRLVEPAAAAPRAVDEAFNGAEIALATPPPRIG